MSFDMDLFYVVQHICGVLSEGQNKKAFYVAQDESYFEQQGLKKSNSLEEIKRLLDEITQLLYVLNNFKQKDSISYEEYERLVNCQWDCVKIFLEHYNKEILGRVIYKDQSTEFDLHVLDALERCNRLVDVLKRDNSNLAIACKNSELKKIFSNTIHSNLKYVNEVEAVLLKVNNDEYITQQEYQVVTNFELASISFDHDGNKKFGYNNPLYPYQFLKGFMDCMKGRVSTELTERRFQMRCK